MYVTAWISGVYCKLYFRLNIAYCVFAHQFSVHNLMHVARYVHCTRIATMRVRARAVRNVQTEVTIYSTIATHNN